MIEIFHTLITHVWILSFDFFLNNSEELEKKGQLPNVVQPGMADVSTKHSFIITHVALPLYKLYNHAYMCVSSPSDRPFEIWFGWIIFLLSFSKMTLFCIYWVVRKSEFEFTNVITTPPSN